MDTRACIAATGRDIDGTPKNAVQDDRERSGNGCARRAARYWRTRNTD